MSARVDHEFVTASVQRATLSHGNHLAQFSVMAEEEDVRLVAKICFVSYMIGPGVKIVLGRETLD